MCDKSLIPQEAKAREAVKHRTVPGRTLCQIQGPQAQRKAVHQVMSNKKEDQATEDGLK